MAAPLDFTFAIPLSTGKDAAHAASIRVRECVQGGKSQIWPIPAGGITAQTREEVIEFATKTPHNFRLETLDGTGSPMGSKTYLPIDPDGEITQMDQPQAQQKIVLQTQSAIGDSGAELARDLMGILGDVLKNTNKALVDGSESLRKGMGKADIPDSFMTLYREKDAKVTALQAKAEQLQTEIKELEVAAAKNKKETPGTSASDVLKEVRGTIADLKSVDPKRIAGEFLSAIADGDTKILQEELAKLPETRRRKIIVSANLAYLASLGPKTPEQLMMEGTWVQSAVIDEIEKQATAPGKT